MLERPGCQESPLKEEASLIHLVLVGEQEATSSNCGKPLKPLIPNTDRKNCVAKNNTLGYGNKSKDVPMGNPQPSPKVFKHNGCSSETQCRWALATGHKIESTPTETWSQRGVNSGCTLLLRRALRDVDSNVDIGTRARVLQLNMYIYYILYMYKK
jgi:hypothetical protein